MIKLDENPKTRMIQISILTGTMIAALIVMSFYLTCQLYFIPTYGSAIPIGQVSGNSMEPTYHNGEWLIYYTPDKKPVELGSVIIFEKNISKNIVVHRVVNIQPDGTMITKGDNNPNTDQALGIDASNVKPSDVYGVIEGPLF